MAWLAYQEGGDQGEVEQADHSATEMLKRRDRSRPVGSEHHPH
jgi:hypothetical protein